MYLRHDKTVFVNASLIAENSDKKQANYCKREQAVDFLCMDLLYDITIK